MNVMVLHQIGDPSSGGNQEEPDALPSVVVDATRLDVWLTAVRAAVRHRRIRRSFRTNSRFPTLVIREFEN